MRAHLFVSVSAIALTATLAVSAVAQESVTLDTVTISATRDQQAPIDALSSTSVVDQAELERIQANRVGDILFGLPGVTTSESGDDPASAVNIRGLQDFGRVNVTIDGARQNFQRSAHNADGSFYIDPDLLKQVTVIRGPVSNAFGSGAIGGVVAFETVDPFDFLKPGERYAISSKLSLSTNSDQVLVSGTGAFTFGDSLGFLGNVVVRERDDYEDGDGNTIFNSSSDVLAGLAKLQLQPSDDTEIDIGYVGNRSDFVTGTPGFQRDNDITDDTLTASFSWDSSQTDLINLSASTYWTQTRTEQLRLDGRRLAGNRREFNIETVGFDVFNTSEFITGNVDHAFTFGIDGFRDEVDTFDPGGSGDKFTPSGQRTVYGGFVQHAVDIGQWLDVIGGLRFDFYELSGGAVEGSGERVSPKITVGVSPFEETAFHGIQVYGTYAEGYRAPAVTETLVQGFHPPPFSFIFFPNPDLEPEVGKTLEFGVNVARDGLFTPDDVFRLKGAYFRNDVENFIDGVFNPRFPPPFGSFTYRNIASAELDGVEVEATYDAGFFFAAIAGHIIRGENADTGVPLVTVPPDKLVTTIGFRTFEERLTIGGRWHAVAKQDRVPVGVPTSDGFNVVDLFVQYEHNDYLSFGANIDNVFDEQYTRYLNQSASEGISATVWVKGRFGA